METTFCAGRGDTAAKAGSARRRLVLASLALALVAGPAAAKGKLVPLIVSHSGNASSLDVRYAIDKGYFREAGLDVKFQVVTSGSQAVPLLLGNRVQLAAIDSFVLLQARSRGLPIQAVSANVVGSTDPARGYANFIVRKDSPFKSGKDLAGKTIAVNQINGTAWVIAKAALDSAGVDPSSVKFVEIPAPLTWNAIEAGRADAGVLTEPNVTIALEEGARVLTSLDAIAYPALPSFVYSGNVSWLTANAEVVKKFHQVLMRSHKELNTDKAAARAYAQTVLKLRPEVLEKMVFPVYGEQPLSVEQIGALGATTVKYGLLPANRMPDAAGTFVKGL